jgi:hypothetical protein
VEPSDVEEVVEKHGRLVVGEEGELMVEFANQKGAEELVFALSKRFGDKVVLCP